PSQIRPAKIQDAFTAIAVPEETPHPIALPKGLMPQGRDIERKMSLLDRLQRSRKGLAKSAGNE
ncbi:MAG TPA: hypothetical protein VKV79_00530, partial [Terriglobia bacterium]|nr:hypothetical protein [Terriglobia bacterium]